MTAVMYQGLDDSTIVAALAEMVRQYPPDWENAETWDNGNGGYFFATLLGKNVMDIRPEDTKVPVVRTLVADVTLDGDIVPGSMHLIEFAGRGLDVTRFKDYVDQWLVGDFQDTPILVAEYTIGYASTVAFLYEPGKEPTQVTMALRRYNRLAKDMTFDLTICYTAVDYELECDDEKKPSCDWVESPTTTCVTIRIGGGGGYGGDTGGPKCFSVVIGCGGGGGGGSGGGGREDKKIEITLFCPKSVVRGDVAECKVFPENDNDPKGFEKLTFKWTSSLGASHTGKSWEGTATDDVTVSVSTTNWSDKAAISITNRTWKLPSPLNVEKEYAKLKPDHGGLYQVLNTTPEPSGGTGPWTGRHYVRDAPTFIGKLYISVDYSSGSDAPKYAFYYKLLTDAGKAACPEGRAITARKVSYRYLNEECDTSTGWVNMHDQILRHELEHQAGINECLKSITTSNFFSKLERLTGNESEVSKELTDTGMWGEYKKKLSTAGLSAARPTTSVVPFFQYKGLWIYSIREAGDHSGVVSSC